MTQVTARGSSGLRTDEVPRPTREQRVARGKAARAEVPRSSHAEFKPAAGRPDPVTLLESQAASRVPELLPIRYGRMAVSAFTFFRGAALPMANDLAGTPRTGLTVQACGDAHLANFGVFASPERNLVFDINDFDETLPGPWEWDVKRLAASLEIAGRDNGFSTKERRAIVLAAVVGVPARDAGVRRPHRARGLVRPRRRRPRSSPGSDRTSARRGAGRSPGISTRRGPRTTSGRSPASPAPSAGSRRSSATRR